MENTQAADMFKKVQSRMAKKPRPVAANDTVGRGSGMDPSTAMSEHIQPQFPKEIHERFNSLEEDLQNDIKEMFTTQIGGTEPCGEMIFDAKTDFETLNESFTTLDAEQQQIFVDLFFNLHIIGT